MKSASATESARIGSAPPNAASKATGVLRPEPPYFVRDDTTGTRFACSEGAAYDLQTAITARGRDSRARLSRARGEAHDPTHVRAPWAGGDPSALVRRTRAVRRA
jgi:hypothetical protein